MATTIDQAFVKQFADNFEFGYQDEQSILGPTVRNETQAGEMKFFDFITKTQGQERSTRNPVTPNINVDNNRRKCTLTAWDWGTTIDDIDQVYLLKDPQSMYTRAARAAYNRWLDEKILAAMGGSAWTGKEGTTEVKNYAAGECRLISSDGAEVAAGSDSGNTVETWLTVAKVALAGKLLDEAGVPAEGRHIIASHVNKWKFLQESDVKTYDVNTVKALAAGTISDFMGFSFHWLPNDRFEVHGTDTGAIKCYAYHRDAVLLSKGSSANASKERITEDPTHCYNTQVYIMRMAGAVRMQGPGVVQIMLDQ